MPNTKKRKVEDDGYVYEKYWIEENSTYPRIQRAKYLNDEAVRPVIVIDVMPEKGVKELSKGQYTKAKKAHNDAYAKSQVDNGGAEHADFFAGKIPDDMMLMLFGRTA